MKVIKKNLSKWMYWFLLGVAIILVYKFLDNFTAIGNIIGNFLDVIAPFLAGTLIAYLLYIPASRIEKGLKKSKFCGIFLNFSDPWPKKRHEKRRLTSPNFLIEYAKLLKEEGYIYFKTDNEDFYQYSYEEFNKFKRDIIYLNENYDCSNQDFDAETEFENRYKLQGIAIKRVILKKTKDTLLELPK